MSRQKQHERFLLDRFMEAAGLSLEIVEGDREAPDFIVRFESRLIGVEVAEIFISHLRPENTAGLVEQALESISTNIVARAQQLYQASGAPPAHITVTFWPGRDLKHLNRDGSANRLASFIQGRNLADGEQFDWYPKDTFENSLPDEISFVRGRGVANYEVAHWSVARAGWVAPVTAPALQSRVDEKSLRLSNYQKAVSENWLVIVADLMKPSAGLYLPPDFDPCHISSPFSRILVPAPEETSCKARSVSFRY